MIDARQLQQLQQTVRKYYKKHARNDLPWRTTDDAYHILVSEIMLQQTQVTRVIGMYGAFIAKFPTVHALAHASLRDVLVAWQGLGYNRRAKMLHNAAQSIVRNYAGTLPRDYATLRTLPGIGPYTAGAVCAFAYNIPIPIIETNIRTVLFYHLLGNRTEVPDSELLTLSATLLNKEDPRTWYYALMDYGAYLKANRVQLNAKSKHYTKQSRFAGSDRQVRGAIVRLLTLEPALTELAIVRGTKHTPHQVRAQLSALKKDGLVHKQKTRWSIETRGI
jgi:A/G-specific adenine glycosylase